jgi:hypothetical protein
MMDHLNADQIRAYVADEMAYNECLADEIHLATCETCSRRVNALFSIKGNFEQIWNTWTAKKHAEEFQVAHLRRALHQANVTETMRQRLAWWVGNMTDLVETAVGISLDASERAVSVVQEGWEFLQGRKSPGFSPVPVPLAIAGEGDPRTWIALETARPPWTKVTIDPVIGRILVQSKVRTVPPPLIALVAKDYDWAAVTSFRTVEGEQFVLAEFEDIPSGEFVLLIEKAEGFSLGSR